jgi:drug/metabolite transporter (DMT)-like permease
MFALVDLPVLALVLLAAIAHAAWNGWLKKSSPDFIGLAAISTGWLIVGAIGVLLVPLPAPASWPYLAATTIVHLIYTGLLVSAYQHGEFSLTYPIARGTGPLLVAIAAPLFLGEQLAGADVMAVALIVPGILVIGLAGAGARLHDLRAILLSLATGVAIALYTLIDAAGARAGPSPHSYSAWLFVLAASALLLVTVFLHRSATLTLLKPHLRRGASVGILSAIAYMIVLWAMTMAPVALVAAVRETSILFAALIAWGILGEKISGLRWVGVMLTAAGLVLARL